MDVVALVRPDEWNFPLLLHVLGASLLVGTLSVAVTAGGLGWRPGEGGAGYARLAFRTLLLGALPSWVLMRVGGQWIYDRQGWGDDPENEPTWLGIGWLTGDLGLLLLLAGVVLAGLGARRLASAGRGGALLRSATVLSAVLLAAYVVTTWAMAGKPD